MNIYELIDPILSRWSEEKGIEWYTEYQGTEVRTFYLNFHKKDRVQIAIDPPNNNMVVINIGQNRRGLWRLNRLERIKTSVSDLSHSLDKAFSTAIQWSENS